MLVQELIMDEMNPIPADKLTELYRLVRQFRLGLVEGQPMPDDKYLLRKQKIVYHEPFEPVVLADWDVLK
ncbi:hypothetical protein KFZ76_09420 [Methylovulum psychrotolerans]|uniref:hypothetical protein n=1 Tax=Methylovulum psychrotolerans TaxID=1704499 RepID=UPI001BFF0323|nr:hypothetical protein [Methylovulum psychrotolerans]MBT9097921.1 hypothetical protein [Methylovulum psychrotolerans]